jgi:hypothetical protein
MHHNVLALAMTIDEVFAPATAPGDDDAPARCGLAPGHSPFQCSMPAGLQTGRQGIGHAQHIQIHQQSISKVDGERFSN